MSRTNRGLAIRGVKEQGTFAQQRPSEVMRQILGDEADDAMAEDVTAGHAAVAGADERDEPPASRRQADEKAKAAATAEAQRADREEGRAATAAAPAADAKRKPPEAAKGNAQTDAAAEKKTPEQLAEIRRSGSRQAVYTRKKDNRGMVKVGFSATRAFDLRLQEFTSLLVDDTRNEWLMRTIDDAMNDQREKLIARRKRIHDMAQRGEREDKT
jgi:hypothetical protein